MSKQFDEVKMNVFKNGHVQSSMVLQNRLPRYQKRVWNLINSSIDPCEFALTDQRDIEFPRFFGWPLTALPNRIAGWIAVHLAFQTDRHSLDDRNSKTR